MRAQPFCACAIVNARLGRGTAYLYTRKTVCYMFSVALTHSTFSEAHDQLLEYGSIISHCSTTRISYNELSRGARCRKWNKARTNREKS